MILFDGKIYADEELDNILTENAVDKVILVGRSLGGYFSQSFKHGKTILNLGHMKTDCGLLFADL